jgi:BASS family bile acid:Na+ symporter
LSIEEIARVFLPISLAMIMFSMGLTLALPDFVRLVQQPRDFLVGAIMQIIAFPIIAFMFVSFIPARSEIAVGFMLVAACPGGVASTMLTQIGRGDLALSIAVTTFSTLLSIVTLPLIVGWSLAHFMGARAPELPIAATMFGIFTILVGPTALGVACAKYSRSFAEWAEPKTRTLAMTSFAAIVVAALVAKRGGFAYYLAVATPIALALNFVMMCFAFVVATWFATGPRQRTAITLGCGVQNAALAVVVAVTTLHSVEIAIPGAAYGAVMLLLGFGFALWSAARTKDGRSPSGPPRRTRGSAVASFGPKPPRHRLRRDSPVR